MINYHYFRSQFIESVLDPRHILKRGVILRYLVTILSKVKIKFEFIRSNLNLYETK